MTKGVILETLKSFKRDKKSGARRVDCRVLYLFFDMMGGCLTKVVDDSPRSGAIPDLLNKTFITLIVKVSKPSSFNKFRSISLCDLLYTLITKVIADRM